MVSSVEEHVLVPKHESLSEEEKADLLKKLEGNEDILPIIRKNDPALKKIKKIKVNDVIRITRPSKLSGTSIYYRVVKK